MRIAILCHGTVLLPAIEALASQNLIVGIAVPAIFAEVNHAIFQVAGSLGLPFTNLNQENLEPQLKLWLQEVEPDVVCMMGFPFRIPEAVLVLPRLGFFNLHGGKLPEYAGPDPIFWQLKNLETQGAITVHRVESDMDTGAVAHVEPVPLGPADTYGIVLQRMGNLLPRALVAFIQQLAFHGDDIALTFQKACDRNYSHRPQEADQSIDWSLPQRSIDALVRACNPAYGGALTAIKGINLRLLQIAASQKKTQDSSAPGTIIHFDSTCGIEIACGEHETLCAEIFCLETGFYTGDRVRRLFNLLPGDQFTSIPKRE
jgi:methionyl-tRNA formyltransferase